MDAGELWGDSDDDSPEAWLERLVNAREFLSRVVADTDAAVGFTKPAEAAVVAALSALDAAIAAEEEGLARWQDTDDGPGDGPPEHPPLHAV